MSYVGWFIAERLDERRREALEILQTVKCFPLFSKHKMVFACHPTAVKRTDRSRQTGFLPADRGGKKRIFLMQLCPADIWTEIVYGLTG